MAEQSKDDIMRIFRAENFKSRYAFGIHPSFKLRSNFLISSAVFAFAIAVLIFCFSSVVINLPDLPGIVAELGRGSSTAVAIRAALPAVVVTVD